MQNILFVTLSALFQKRNIASWYLVLWVNGQFILILYKHIFPSVFPTNVICMVDSHFSFAAFFFLIFKFFSVTFLIAGITHEFFSVMFLNCRNQDCRNQTSRINLFLVDVSTNF